MLQSNSIPAKFRLLQIIDPLNINPSYIKDYSLQLYFHAPDRDVTSKNNLLTWIANEFSTSAYTGKIIRCSRIPTSRTKNGLDFLAGGKMVVILTTTNPNMAITNNISYVITPIFYGRQTNDSIQIFIEGTDSNFDGQIYVEASSPLATVNKAYYIDFNFIFTYKYGTSWIDSTGSQILQKYQFFKGIINKFS